MSRQFSKGRSGSVIYFLLKKHLIELEDNRSMETAGDISSSVTHTQGLEHPHLCFYLERGRILLKWKNPPFVLESSNPDQSAKISGSKCHQAMAASWGVAHLSSNQDRPGRAFSLAHEQIGGIPQRTPKHLVLQYASEDKPIPLSNFCSHVPTSWRGVGKLW